MDVAEETDPLDTVEVNSIEGKPNPVIEDGLLSLLHQDFARGAELPSLLLFTKAIKSVAFYSDHWQGNLLRN